MRRLGVIGHPVGHSVSPAFQQAALDTLHLSLRYERYDVPPEMVDEFVRALRVPEWLGVNVTIPHKQAVMRDLDQLTPDALRIGA
ncbi:MAG: shikimate dehydrogenase, partial [Chloroflexota bacterium]|nr:shikimate dehydrogenase [Chloroflexota bacterium]